MRRLRDLSGTVDRRRRWGAGAIVGALAVLVSSCSGLSGTTFETDSGSWVLFTQSAFLMGGRAAEVFGFATAGSYPKVNGSTGGGGYFDVDEVEGGETADEAAILRRCPGIDNQHGEVAVFDLPADEIEIGK